MRYHRYKFFGLILACSYWLFDSTLHKWGYGEEHFEFIPSDFNELWMRLVIFVLVIILGAYADYHTKKIIDAKEEKIKVYQASLKATHHILNNFLNKMQFFMLSAQKSADLDPKVLVLFDKVIHETKDHVTSLEDITEITPESIEDAFKPK